MSEFKNIAETVVEHTPIGEYWGIRYILVFGEDGFNARNITADNIVGGDGL